ncbi:hypothetical protein [Mesobacillus jeotgali]|uniref:Uncharacterized protein n=1 Tax=Mesobacillus jeotgali TaxID=129985 RepID=A0ABY9VIA5_9BACI|nr:hypothetical protein [Mesobacillus jeotgali]WNF23388.1 hypothetical protein RH061_02440 [Mesobacillus jeotgali]
MAVVMIAAVIAIINKPNEADFAIWMEDTYEVQCLDEQCGAFQIEEGNEKILMNSVRGGYAPGIFITKINNTYRNFEDPSYQLDLEVAGFFGKIMIENEKIKRINKR